MIFSSSLAKHGWKECKLGDVAEFGNGKARPKTEGLIPVYGGNGILSYCDQFNYNSETIIIGRVGAYCGSVYYENKPVWVSDNALSVKTKSKNNTKFIFYFLKNLNINQLAEGSSHPLITQTLLKSIDVVITDNENEQRAIAGVLSSLDDKIDLLRRQNKTLEGIAESLWRKMFVKDADPKWRRGILGEVVTVSTGKGLKRNEYIENGIYPVIGANGEIGRTNNYLTDENLILTGRVGTLGELFINYNQKIWISDNVLIIKPKADKYFYFIYFFLKEIEFENLNVGSTQPLITQTDLKQIECVIPLDSLIDVFQNQSVQLFNKIQRNINLINTLERLCDTLLPKLMSGEVKVGYGRR